MALIPFNVSDPHHLSAAARIWNASATPDLAMTADFIGYNCSPQADLYQAGWFALADGRPVGFAHVSYQAGQALGWLDVLAVETPYQRRGLGQALLAQAEGWLKTHQAQRVRLAGASRAFFAGLPEPLDSVSFFQAHGYQPRDPAPKVWDVAHDLALYQPLTESIAAGVAIRPVEPQEVSALLDFLGRAFPGRWHDEISQFLACGGRSTDILALHDETGVNGFCWMTFEDSFRPLNRYFPANLPRPWGQFGPLGVSKACRGRGYGGALIDAAARHLSVAGVRGCIIDWTDLVELYAKFGFHPYREYGVYLKNL